MGDLRQGLREDAAVFPVMLANPAATVMDRDEKCLTGLIPSGPDRDAVRARLMLAAIHCRRIAKDADLAGLRRGPGGHVRLNGA